MEFEFGGAVAAAEDDVVEVEDAGVDVGGEAVGEAEGGDAADEHAGEVAGVVGGGEGEASDAHELADGFVDVEFGVGGGDAGGELFGVASGGDDDGVGGVGGGDVVALAELGGVGEIGVAGENFVVDAVLGEGGFDRRIENGLAGAVEVVGGGHVVVPVWISSVVVAARVVVQVVAQNRVASAGLMGMGACRRFACGRWGATVI